MSDEVLRDEVVSEFYRWRWHRDGGEDASVAELEVWAAGYLAGGRGALRNSVEFAELVPRLRELLAYFDGPRPRVKGLETSDSWVVT